MKLDNNDKIVGVRICKNNQDAILSTKLGNVLDLKFRNLEFLKEDLQKVKGIELSPNDEIVFYQLLIMIK